LDYNRRSTSADNFETLSHRFDSINDTRHETVGKRYEETVFTDYRALAIKAALALL